MSDAIVEVRAEVVVTLNVEVRRAAVAEFWIVVVRVADATVDRTGEHRPHPQHSLDSFHGRVPSTDIMNAATIAEAEALKRSASA